MKKLSIIIVTYNSEKDIYDCLRTVFQYNDLGEALEVIIVDNASKDFAIMKERLLGIYGDKICVISNTANGGYGQGNNIGIRAAMAPYFAIMNPDVRLMMPIFGAMVHVLEQKDVAMCGGKQMGSNLKPLESFRVSCFEPNWYRVFVQYVCRFKLDKYLYKTMWLQGAFFAMRKDVFEAIGMFDENIFLYWEENDIHYRLRKSYPQLRCAYLKNIQYVHCAEERPYSQKSMLQMYQSLAYLYEKYGMAVVKNLEKEIRFNKWMEFIINAMDRIKSRPNNIMHTQENNQLLQSIIETHRK